MQLPSEFNFFSFWNVYSDYKVFMEEETWKLMRKCWNGAIAKQFAVLEIKCQHKRKQNSTVLACNKWLYRTEIIERIIKDGGISQWTNYVLFN